MPPVILLTFTAPDGRKLSFNTRKPFPTKYWPEIKDNQLAQEQLVQIALQIVCRQYPKSHYLYPFIDSLPHDSQAYQILHNTRRA